MRLRRGAMVGLVAGTIFLAPPAGAAFDELDTGARGQGMGTAGAAMIEDVSAFAWNPSALDRLERTEAFAAYGIPLGVNDLYSGAVAVAGRAPGRLRSFGAAVGWRRYGVRGIYAEDLWQVSAGKGAWRPASGHEVALGASLKIARIGFGEFADPSSGAPVAFGSRTRLSFDTAATWRTPWKVDLLWAASDWTSPEFDFVEGPGASTLSARHRIAGAFRWNRESTVGAAWTSPGERGGSRLDLGLEIWFFDVFAIRSGLTDIGGVPDPGSSAQRFQYAGGIGLRDDRWRLDAAVATTRELGTSYRFSLIVPIGSSSPTATGAAEARP